jgi:hypothetical protein
MYLLYQVYVNKDLLIVPKAHSFTSSTAILPNNPHRILNEPPTGSQSGLSPGDVCREAWQSQFSSIVYAMVTTTIIDLMTRDSLLEYTTSTILLNSPIVSEGVFTSTTYLPVECDGYTRLSENAYTEIRTAMSTLSSFYKLRSGSVLPFSPTPTSTYTQTHRTEMVPWNTVTCTIPKEECPQQWKQFGTFLRTWKPDFGDMAAAFAYYEARLNNEGSHIRYGNDSLTGSNFMDRLVELTYHGRRAVDDFFGRCVEARKHVMRGVQLYLERLDWNDKWANATRSVGPFRLGELSVEQATELIFDFCTCHLQTDHGMLIQFEQNQAARKRDVCANDGWGDSPVNLGDRFKPTIKSASTATLTAITFPYHYNPGN